MLALLVDLPAGLRSTIRSRAALAAENLALRHQLAVLRRQAPRRLRLCRTDRLLWVWLSRAWSEWRHAVQIVSPDTVVRWHRRGFALSWRWKPRPRGTGRPAVAADLRDLIRQMRAANPLWGAPRIHGEWRKLGIEISQATVAKHLGRRPRKPPSQTWRALLATHVSQLASIDFFAVPAATSRVLFVFVVLAHDRRRIVRVNVTAHPTAVWTAQPLREAGAWDAAPRFLIGDRDGIDGEAFGRAMRSFATEKVLTAPHSPWQSPFVERVIGSVRRECLDHVIIWNERALRRHLRRYLRYDHAWRPHLSLDKDAPIPRATQPPTAGPIVQIPEVGGLHHHDERRAA